ncbi:protein takeout isoform X2 [Agrilus planipennis]|uniref:Protein takeout isoform X2 n=1 Tax=Agrilus planipennis TaxID=224129 RepID=A0A7F5RF46_AGRPL|nr:protein takeout isoform X2 [Agrilus planipennis]
MTTELYFGIIAVLFSVVFAKQDIPPFLHVCHRQDPELNQCFIAAGVPEYNIPSLEPLIMDQLISEDLSGIHIEAKDVKAWGCSKYFVRNNSVDVENQKYQLDVYLPELQIEAYYTVDGKLLLMPVKGEGPMKANITHVVTKVKLEGETFESNGERFLKYTSMVMKVTVGGGHVLFSNLFSGDKLLNDVINLTINNNFDAFLKELLPVIEKSLSAVFLDISNKIVNKFTFDQLFPM